MYSGNFLTADFRLFIFRRKKKTMHHDEMHTARLHPKRASRTTSCTDGASPLQPATGRRSSKDSVNARAAEQARTALHLRTKAAFALFCKKNGQDWALASATAAENFAVSPLHRQPTSAARTTRRARPPSPDNSGQVRSLRRRASTKTAPSWSAARALADPSRRKGETSVNRQLRTVPQRQSVSDHLQTATIQIVVGDQIQVTHWDICRNTCSSFTAHLCSGTLQWTAPFPRNPCQAHATRWWPKISCWRPHQQVRIDRGGQVQSPAQEKAERLRVQSCRRGHW